MKFPVIHTIEQLVDVVDQIGFIPFFQNDIPGYSIEDLAPPEMMFVKGTEGPWEWREELAQTKACVYGKLFAGRTGFISLAWFPDFANYRRDGYDFDARWDDDLASYREKRLYDLIEQHGSCPSPELRRIAGVEKGKSSSFESAMTRLQMRTYILPVKCAFTRNKQGEKYGYGTASFDLAEHWLGSELCTSKYHVPPEESYAKILEHLQRFLGSDQTPQIEKLIRIS